MSAIYLDNRLLHYEVFGRSRKGQGEPIIFLHSWVGSWRYWVPTMDIVSERHRCYAFDFWGFGDSERNEGLFNINEYVECLMSFIQHLAIPQVNLVGHGLGGMVAIRSAQQYPEYFARLVTVSTPLQGQILREVCKPGTFSRFLGRNNPISIWSKLIRQIPVDDTDVQQELYEDTDSLSEQVVQHVQDSIIATDLQPILAQWDSVPLLAIYGGKDTIVPATHAQFLNDSPDQPHQLIVLPQANHFPFLEKASTFSRLLLDFINEEGKPVEVKEQWRRRVSQREYL